MLAPNRFCGHDCVALNTLEDMAESPDSEVENRHSFLYEAVFAERTNDA